ncbi:MAG: TonB-dependent receptor, partial [Chitinophagaceae bacterium]
RVPGFDKVFEEDRPDDLDYIATQAEILKEQSFYTEVAYDLTTDWEVLLGARHFRFKDDANVCSLLFPISEPYVVNDYPLACIGDKDDESGNLGKFSSKYKFNEYQNIYFTVAEGFRRGGTNILPVEAINNRSYAPDKVVNYELGTHSDFLNGRLVFNGSLFYMKWKDVQVSAYNQDGNLITANAGTARSKGVELEALAQLNQFWNLRFNYSYTDAALTESVALVSNERDKITAESGDRLPGSPKQQWGLGLNYQQMINTATLSAHINYAYSGDIATALNKNFADYDQLDGYSTVNAKVELSWSNWQLGAFVNNLGNTHAITGKRSPVFYGEMGQFDYITRPRTIGLTAKYQF